MPKNSNEMISLLVNDIVERMDISDEELLDYVKPYSPALFILIGSCRMYEPVLKETLGRGWNTYSENVKYLQYESLADAAQFKELREAIESEQMHMRMLGEDAFQSFSEFRIYVFAELTDTESKTFLELLETEISQIQEMLSLDCRLVLMAMINRAAKSYTRSDIKQKIRHILSLKKCRVIAGALVLSTELVGGRILSEENIDQNYRLAADIAFVSNSYDLSEKKRQQISIDMENDLMGSNQICTASYIAASKPLKAIAQTVLQSVLNLHTETEEEAPKRQNDDSKYAFFTALKGTDKAQSSFGLLEWYTKNIVSQFPNSEKLRYLPYSSAFDKEKRNGFASAQDIRAAMSPESLSVLNSFQTRFYTKKIDQIVIEQKEELYQAVLTDLKAKISYIELLEYSKEPERLEEIRNDIETAAFAGFYRPVLRGNEIAHLLAADLERSSWSYFVKQAGSLCLQAFDQYLEEAGTFNEMVRSAKECLSQVRIEKTVQDFYGSKTRKMMSYNRNRREYLEIFTEYSKWYEYLKELLQETILTDSVFRLPFEQEVRERMQAVHSGTGVLELLGFDNSADQLSDACRLEYGTPPTGNVYCMVYQSTKLLERANFLNMKIFTTGWKDSVERLQMCRISCDTTYFNEET